MTNAERHLMTLFAESLEFTSPPERAAFLDRTCGKDPALRQHLEALLEAHAHVGRFLDPQAAVASASSPEARKEIAEAAVDNRTAVPPGRTDGPGAQIGPYKLLQQIGEGGMGTVFMAEQTQPVQRKVALKIVKPGMDSRQVIARFEAERQALALMDHPNIAKVLDAGTTEARRPFFVMELVKGVPITRFCDEHRLTPRQRLELFVPVCQAVQHAHQKGVIHRDLKPSNVLVAEYDDKPVPKVIDFGVAKATGPKLTERTMFTELGQVVGTLEYMSPEQAKLNALEIDTRSDIHALGVLLYELLTGTTPFEKKRFQQAAFDEILRIIREEEPQKPSTRLSTTEELPSIAANRGLEPKKLSGLVRGELDWIVMRCLEKDRNRRYETANGLARDVQRYLADVAIEACPPSAWYRFRKFTRRNKELVMNVANGMVWGLVGMLLGLYFGTSHMGENAGPISSGTSISVGEWVLVLLGIALFGVLAGALMKKAKGPPEKTFVLRLSVAFFLAASLTAVGGWASEVLGNALLGRAIDLLGWGLCSVLVNVLVFQLAVKNAKGPREKAFVLRSSVGSALVCIALLLGVALIPGWYKHLLWVPFVIIALFSNRWHKRVVSRIRREESRVGG
jgi:serine/threonine protein kinase